MINVYVKITIIGLSCILSLPIYTQTTSFTGNKLKYDSVRTTVFDFGTVTEGEVITNTFKVKNTSTDTLIIEDSDKDCGCIVYRSQIDTILPGGNLLVDSQFNTINKLGPRKQRIYIEFKNGKGRHELVLKGNVNAKKVRIDRLGAAGPLLIPYWTNINNECIQLSRKDSEQEFTVLIPPSKSNKLQSVVIVRDDGNLVGHYKVNEGSKYKLLDFSHYELGYYYIYIFQKDQEPVGRCLHIE